MSDRKPSPQLSRRGFLEGTVLTSALLPGMRLTAAESCPPANAPMKDVEGKVAFITGGDSGIGLGIARACVEAGMKVVITYRTKSHLDEAMKQLESAGNRVHAVNLDVTDRAGMEKAAAETLRVFQKVHVLVNNAGVGVIGGLSKATYDDWDWGMSVNVTGVFNGIRTFLPHIQAHGEAIVASLPTDVVAPPGREAMGRMVLGKPTYAAERDRRRCERARSKKA